MFGVVHSTPEGAEIKPGVEKFPNQHGLSRKNIFSSVDASLARLQLDYIDVLQVRSFSFDLFLTSLRLSFVLRQCHRFDYDTPIEETMQALHDVVQTGKVRYIGMSRYVSS